MTTTRRLICALLLVAPLGACTIETQSRSSPPPSYSPPPAGANGSLRVALIPTRVSGVGETKAGAWNEAFRQALADPRYEFPDPKDVEKTVDRHKKGRFNAFTDVNADVWIETSVYTQKEAAYNKLTKKIEDVPQLRFTARVMKTLDDRGTSYTEAGRLYMNEAVAAQDKTVDAELLKKVAEKVRGHLKSGS